MCCFRRWGVLIFEQSKKLALPRQVRLSTHLTTLEFLEHEERNSILHLL